MREAELNRQRVVFTPQEAARLPQDRPYAAYICHYDWAEGEHATLMHCHERLAEVLLILKGSGRYTVDLRRYEVAAGDVVLCSGGALHDEFPQADQPYQTLCVAIGNLALADLPPYSLLSPDRCPLFHQPEQFADLKELFCLMDRYAAEREPGFQELCQHLMLASLELVRRMAAGRKEDLVTREDSTFGRVARYIDPLLDCKACKARHRADKLIGEEHHEVNVDAMSFDEMDKFIAEHEDIVCPVCGKHDFTPIRKFNLMFKTAIGVTEDSSSTCYLRPETAQGIFVNFANIQRTTRRKLPFGVCQVGKAFRNEITPGNFTFRTREFEQMECEFFCKPGTDLEWFAYWKEYCVNWLKSLGIHEENLRLRDHEPAELAFYSRATTDIEYAFPFTDWGELWGIADRTDYDLKRHQEASGKDLTYFDQETNEHYIPYVIEPSLGCDRVALAFLCEAYDEEVIDAEKNDVRVVLHLHPALAPYKAAILPLSKKLAEPAKKLFQDLCPDFMLDYDETGSIGKRYRREDEIGTPYCITVDFATVGDEKTPADNAVTIRDRDTMEQVRVPIAELKTWLAEHTKF